MGTPDFAVASLRRLVEDGHEVVGVFTQPDKPKNRGMKLTFSPVKEYALTQYLPVYQPLKMRDGEALGILRELAPELIVVAAYGKILPQEILDLPRYGCINVHSSLLPKYRGAAPHQLGDPERRAHYRRFHHVYGRGARRGRCHPHGLDRDR